MESFLFLSFLESYLLTYSTYIIQKSRTLPVKITKTSATKPKKNKNKNNIKCIKEQEQQFHNFLNSLRTGYMASKA